MKTETYTPGPWTVCEDCNNNESPYALGVRGGAEQFFVADVWFDVDDLAGSAKANACLIAAAPELLEALKDLIDRMSEPGCADHTLGAFLHGVGVANARKAIAKAEARE